MSETHFFTHSLVYFGPLELNIQRKYFKEYRCLTITSLFSSNQSLNAKLLWTE